MDDNVAAQAANPAAQTAPQGLGALKIDRVKGRRSGWLPWIIFFLLAGSAAVGGPYAYNEWQGVPVKVAPVTRADDGQSGLTAAGYIVADRQSVLAFKGTGRLTKLNVKESQRVKKGELIAEVDHLELDAGIEEARRGVDEARAEAARLETMIDQAEKSAEMSKRELIAAAATFDTMDADLKIEQVMMEDAKRRYERDKNLAMKSAMPLSSAEDRETEIKLSAARMVSIAKRRIELEKKISVGEAQIALSQSAIPVAKGALAVQNARIRSAEQRIKVLEATVVESSIYSPFDGVVTEKAAEVGEIVAPISIGGSMARGSIATIAEWDSLQAEVDVAEVYIGRVHADQLADISVDSFPKRIFPGKVKRVLPRANRSKATVQVRVEFLEKDNGILPDMGIRVKFKEEGAEAAAKKDVLLIPKAALQGETGKYYVWVAGIDGKVSRRDVEATFGDPVEIKKGLISGEKVVVEGAEALRREGQKFRLKE